MGHDDDRRRDPDAEAILTRRGFLVRTALASAGLALVGCKGEQATGRPEAPAQPEPQPCLGVEPQVCLSQPMPVQADVQEPTDIAGAVPGSDAAAAAPAPEEPAVCLKIAVQDDVVDVPEADMPAPTVCLRVAPREDDDLPEPAPMICLSELPPDDL